MTQNEIVSHNLQLVMDALTEDEYRRFMANYLYGDWFHIDKKKYGDAVWVIGDAFSWRTSNEQFGYWKNIFRRLSNDNKHK